METRLESVSKKMDAADVAVEALKEHVKKGEEMSQKMAASAASIEELHSKLQELKKDVEGKESEYENAKDALNIEVLRSDLAVLERTMQLHVDELSEAIGIKRSEDEAKDADKQV